MSRSITRIWSCAQLLAQPCLSKAPIHTLSIAKGQDEREIVESLQTLIRDTGGRWSVTQSGKGIHAEFHFKTFEHTWVSAILLFTFLQYQQPVKCMILIRKEQ